MNWYSFTTMLSEILVVTVLFQSTIGFELFDGEHHQGLLPVPRIENTGFLSLLEDQPPSGGILSYVRPGRRMLKLPQTLIPYPRTGRVTDEDYDLALIPDYPSGSSESENSDPREHFYPMHFGRKKRSVSEDNSESREEDSIQKRQDIEKAIFRQLDQSYYSPDFSSRQSRRPNSRSRNSFVPRVGKRPSEDELDDVEDKRAAKFTPRIGRASLIPRIGRNDPRFKVKSRGAFIPRIGRRASLTPRIGRSQERHGENENN